VPSSVIACHAMKMIKASHNYLIIAKFVMGIKKIGWLLYGFSFFNHIASNLKKLTARLPVL